MSKRIFGKVKGLPKPKTPEQWHALYLKHQVFLPHVSRLALFFSRFGPGQAGVRTFKYDSLPPIQYWNKDIQCEIHKSIDKEVASSFDTKVVVTLKSGEEVSIPAKDKKAKDILAAIQALAPTEPASSTTASVSQ